MTTRAAYAVVYAYALALLGWLLVTGRPPHPAAIVAAIIAITIVMAVDYTHPRP